MIKSKENIQSFLIAFLLIIIAAVTRFIPYHPFNFTAIGAMALFSGVAFRDKRIAFLLPMAAMFISDLFIGFHFSILPVYACFVFTVWMGVLITRNQTVFNIGCMSLLSSIVFFLVTNLPLWYLDLRLYPMTVAGTLESYSMALPFFRNQIAGDLFYNTLLFGSFYLLMHKRSSVTVIKAHKK